MYALAETLIIPWSTIKTKCVLAFTICFWSQEKMAQFYRFVYYEEEN